MDQVIDPRFTVLMPVHNRADIFLLFDKVIESVFNNTVIPKELVLVVDGPLDSAFKQKIHELESRYSIKVIWVPENKGITFALNTGLAAIDTQWTMRADADDINLPNRFQLQVAALEQGFDLVGGAIEEVDHLGQLLAVKCPPEDAISIRKYVKYRNPFNHMTVAFVTKIAKELGGYPQLALKEDYGLWALFLKNGAKVINLKDILVRATTGRAMYARRGGWSSIQSEIKLQRHLIECKVQSNFMGILVALTRIALLALPASALTTFYMRFLRSRSSSAY
jgi:glycosyltransferase involved in cell wall biosynthesis